MNLKKAFLMLTFFSFIHLNASDYQAVGDSISVTPRGCNRSGLCAGVVGFGVIMGIFYSLPHLQYLCDSNALDDAGNLLPTEWQAVIAPCDAQDTVLSPIYCASNATISDIRRTLAQVNPDKAVCAVKANATANNQTCVNFTPESLVETLVQCNNANAQKPHSKKTKTVRLRDSLKQTKEAEKSDKNFGKRKPPQSFKRSFNSGR